MATNLIVSARGQVTLPAEVRARFGIRAGGVMILEEVEGALVLHPAAVVAVETYSDEQIARWDEDDRLAAADRAEMVTRFGVNA